MAQSKRKAGYGGWKWATGRQVTSGRQRKIEGWRFRNEGVRHTHRYKNTHTLANAGRAQVKGWGRGVARV